MAGCKFSAYRYTFEYAPNHWGVSHCTGVHRAMPRTKQDRTPVPMAVYSIKEFCEAHGISRTMYFKLKRKGQGPREMQIGARVVISLESAAAWRRAREQT
jgi:hypothetical protein